MDITNTILDSRVIRMVALIVGLLAGIAKLVNFVFPNAVQIVVTLSLVLVILYFSIIIFQKIYQRFINRQKNLISNEVKAVFNELIETNSSETTNRLFSHIDQRILEQVETKFEPLPDLLPLKPTDLSPNENTYLNISGRYGMGYDTLHIQCTIKADGSASVRRKVEVDVHSELSSLDTYMLMPETSDRGEALDPIKFTSVQSLTPDRNVTLTGQKEELGKHSATIEISPTMHEGESFAYELLENLPVSLFAIGFSRDELFAREMPYDYFGWNINRPTRRLILRVYFPEDFKPEIFATEVRFASASGFPSYRKQTEEQKRLKRPKIVGPEGNRYILTLDVSYPMIGLIYILRWRPVTIDSNYSQPAVKGISKIKSASISDHSSALRQILTDHFSVSELRSLCFELDLDYDALSGREHSDKVIELISYFKRRDQNNKLIKIGKQQRPDVTWPE